MSNFHQSRAWQKLSKDFKSHRCHDCGSSKDIQAGHILAAKRFPMARLWKVNLKKQCKPCNLKQGVKLRRDLLTLKLLIYYWVIFIMKWIIILIVISLAGRFLWIDQARADWTWDTSISCQVYNEIIQSLDNLRM